MFWYFTRKPVLLLTNQTRGYYFSPGGGGDRKALSYSTNPPPPLAVNWQSNFILPLRTLHGDAWSPFHTPCRPCDSPSPPPKKNKTKQNKTKQNKTKTNKGKNSSIIPQAISTEWFLSTLWTRNSLTHFRESYLVTLKFSSVLKRCHVQRRCGKVSFLCCVSFHVLLSLLHMVVSRKLSYLQAEAM